MRVTRRAFLGGVAAFGAAAVGSVGCAAAAEENVASTADAVGTTGVDNNMASNVASGSVASAGELPMTVSVHSPWMSNAVALTSDNTIFVGLPRFPGHETTPSVARIAADGTAWPFPGGEWNNWQPGADPTNAFVYVNSVHIFADDTVWCVDQGALRTDVAPPGAQKMVQLDAKSGKVVSIIRFDEDVAPPGSKINDLRIYGPLIYITDSGLGGIIVHDTRTGKSFRRLSGFKEVLASAEKPRPGSHHVTPKSDLIEISADGEWLYWASPTGPFRRVRTRYLRDRSMSDKELASHVELYADTMLVGGSAMDTLGNLYLADIHGHRVIVRSPSGQQAVLASHPQLFSADAPFISADRRLYIPSPQTELTALFGGSDRTHRPFLTFVVSLPTEFAGIPLGNALTGRVLSANGNVDKPAA